MLKPQISNYIKAAAYSQSLPTGADIVSQSKPPLSSNWQFEPDRPSLLNHLCEHNKWALISQEIPAKTTQATNQEPGLRQFHFRS